MSNPWAPTVYNVRSYGAHGLATVGKPSSGNDDSAAIQACFNDTPDGSIIYFPRGVYRVDSTILVNTPRLRIVGEGPEENTAIYFTAKGDPIFEVQTGSTRWECLTLIGDGAATGGGMDATNIGILARKDSPLFYDFDMYLDRVSFHRLRLGVDYRGRNCKVVGCGFSHVKDGILFTGAMDGGSRPSGGNRDYEVHCSRFHSCGSPHTGDVRSRCIVFPPHGNGAFEMLIADNLADDCEAFVSGNVRSGIVSGNMITRQAQDIPAIELSNAGNGGSGQGVAIIGNQVARIVGETTGDWTGQHGIKVTGNYYCITGNIIVRMGGNGILCAASNSTIVGNSVINPSYGTPSGGCAAIRLTGPNNIAANNYCLRDDTTNSGMSYGVEADSQNFLGPALVNSPVTAAVQFDDWNLATTVRPIMEIATSVTLSSLYDTILVDTGGVSRTLTLPPAASHKGRVFTIKKIDAAGNTVTIDGNANETIDGAATKGLSSQYEKIVIQSDGTEWWVIG